MGGFFGGDPSLSHFSASLSHGMERKARSEAFKAIKAMGYREVYHQYRNGDAAGKAKAKAKAERDAAKWEAKSGYKFVAYEGCFL